MPTSELTDALNPFIGQEQEQSQSHYHQYPSQSSNALPPQSSFAPHRSELEYAISEPPPPPRYPLVETCIVAVLIIVT
jgi:hypothetical protein